MDARRAGHARPLRYVVAGFALSALLCPTLVYGWLGMPRLGLSGSAVANVAASGWPGCCVLPGAVGRRGAAAVRSRGAAGAGGDGSRPSVRTLAFQACFVSAAAVAARFGRRRRRRHQVVCSCGVSLRWCWIRWRCGAVLGRGGARRRPSRACEVGRVAGDDLLDGSRRRRWPRCSRRGRRRCLGLFTSDDSVLDAIGVPWWFLVAQLPIAGVVFALEGGVARLRVTPGSCGTRLWPVRSSASCR